ncbi:MAG: sulfite exporter TauE/SafE family protein [Verrucomicrobia bacterium]|nr:sulfite exporter TauE/SafE family protein [Verrucomicrobiota bacterium]
MDSASLQLGTAFVLGLLDSLFGHSRALIAGYFLDARRPASHAVWLTIILIVTHTFMLVGLVALALYARAGGHNETVEHGIELTSAALMTGLGVWMIHRNWGSPGDECCHLDHHHHQQHQDEARTQSLGQVWVLGVAGGLLPCANGWAVLLQAASARNLPLAGGIVLAFSAGLGLAVFGLSLAARKAAGHIAARGWARRLPLASAGIVLVMGIISAAQGIGELMGHHH